MEKDVKISTRLNDLLKAKALSQSEAAKVCNVSRTTMNNWIHGVRPTNFKALLKLANLLGVSLAYLLTGKEDELDDQHIVAENKRFLGGEEIFSGYLKVNIQKVIPIKKGSIANEIDD